MSAAAPARVAAATERLYALLPAHVRTVDAANGWAMKALIQVLAGGSVEIDTEIDALLDSMFVETAPEAALPEIAALVASEPLRALPAGSVFSERAFIANTIRYRRGKGTARVLEALAADVAGMGAIAVEYFQRLVRLQDVIDVRAERPGTGDLVPGITASRAGTGFDTLARLVDVRSIARAGGRHHVPNIGVHVLRPLVRAYGAPGGSASLEAAQLAGVPSARAWTDGATTHPGYFQLSEQPGRPLRLFNPDRRSETQLDRVVETDLPDRLRRLPLHRETDALRLRGLGRTAPVDDPPWFDTLGQPFTIFLRATGATTFTRVEPDQVRVANLDAPPAAAGARPDATTTYTWFDGAAGGAIAGSGVAEIACGFDPVTGRLIVAKPAAGAADIEEVRVAYAFGMGGELGAGPQDRNTTELPFDIVDTGRLTNFIRIVDATAAETGAASASLRPVKTLATALAEWAASGAGTRGLIVLARCDREGAAGGATTIPVAVHPGSELHIVSAQWRPNVAQPGVPFDANRRGYLVRRERRFTVDAPLRVTAAAPPPDGGRPGILVLDGLELTGGLSLGARAVSRLLVRHSTVRAPGGNAISTTAPLDGAQVELDRSIVGRVNLDFGGGAAVGSLVVTDSLVSTDDGAGSAIAATSLDVRLRNVTVLGTSSCKSLEGTNVIFSDTVTVTRRQAGCLRFSWIPTGSRVPRRFRCQPDLAITAAAAAKDPVPLTTAERDTVALGMTPLFLDTSLDEPAVAMLHPLTRDAIRLGGEGDTEMGAFAAAAAGLRLANLASLFDDYVPFGLEAGVIDDTSSSAVSRRRNRP